MANPRAAGAVIVGITNMAVLGNGTDTGNAIRMPVASGNPVGIFPTHGLVSIAGSASLDSLLDDTGPVARDVADAVLPLDVMAGADPLDTATLMPSRRFDRARTWLGWVCV